MKEKLKRQLKHSLSSNNRFDLNKLPLFIFLLFTLLFFGTQLYVNSLLSPLGSRLQSFKTEKDLLLQENREIEKDLANAQSITVVENLTNRKYKLAPTKTTQLVYVSGNINASR